MDDKSMNSSASERAQQFPEMARFRRRMLWAGAGIGMLTVGLLPLSLFDRGWLSASEYAERVWARLPYVILAAAWLSCLFAASEGKAKWSTWARNAFHALVRCGESQPRLFLIGLFSLTLAAELITATLVLQSFPYSPDEFAYLTQAKMFADWRLSLADSCPVTHLFLPRHVGSGGGVTLSTYPPGWPAVLSLGAMLGVPWAVNPVISAATICLAFCLAKRAFGVRVAVVASFVMLCSPWLLLTGASYHSHPLSLMCTTMVVFGLERCLTDPRRFRFSTMASGLSVGMLAACRPYDALILSWLLLAASIYLVWKHRAFGTILVLLTSTMLPILIAAMYYAILWGTPATERFSGDLSNVGLGALDLGEKRLWVSALYIRDLAKWGMVGSPVFAMAWFAQKKGWRDLVLVMLCVSWGVAYALPWFARDQYGPRYYYAAASFYSILLARGACALPLLFGWLGLKSTGKQLVNVSAILAALTLLSMSYFAVIASKAIETRSSLPQTFPRGAISNAVVFIASWELDFRDQVLRLNDYGTYDNDILYARYTESDVASVRDCFPDRTLYLCHYDDQEERPEVKRLAEAGPE